jgi:hypothetical protein
VKLAQHGLSLTGDAGPEKGRCENGLCDTWSIMWNPEGSEGVEFTLVGWLDMSYGELDAFQHGFNVCLKKRLDNPGAMPVSVNMVLKGCGANGTVSS